MERHSRRLGWVVVAAMAAIGAGCGQAAMSPPASADEAKASGSAADSKRTDAAPAKAPASPVEKEAAAASEAPPAEPAKGKREPIYHTDRSGKELIAAALRRAERDHKHVLIEWGGNWCGWCYRLHDVFTKNEDVRPLVHEEFVLVLVDSNDNQELMKEYGGKDRRYSFPHLTVLDEKGEVLTNQNTEPLEKGQAHDPQAVAAFLKKWMPPKIDAEEALAKALQRAADDDSRVLVRVGNPYCGWCNVLAQFVQDHADLFAKDYVDLKIDTMRMTNGEEVAKRYSPGNGGVPWMVILDATGKTLAHSFGPKGNIGYPYQPAEVEHFVGMLRESRKNLTDGDLETISADLTAFRTRREEEQAKEAKKE